VLESDEIHLENEKHIAELNLDRCSKRTYAWGHRRSPDEKPTTKGR
jgi:hypothetical protein